MNLFKKYSIKLDYMDATDILYIPNDERVNRIIINMSYSEKIYTLESLLKHTKEIINEIKEFNDAFLVEIPEDKGDNK